MRNLLILALLACAGLARAEFTIPGYELVQTAPVETSLGSTDLRDPVTVWNELFDGAKKEIVFGQFYVVRKPGSPFEKVVEHLAAAGKRGVKIRFLLDGKGSTAFSEAPSIEQLKKIPNLELRILDYNKVTGNGIIHAKYLVVDGRAAYIGSQNFDWRSFTHIHETGMHITDPVVAAQVQAVFEQDWKAQAAIAAGLPVPLPERSTTAFSIDSKAFLLASPGAFNPPGVGDTEVVFPQLLAQAQKEVRAQVLEYAPLSYGPPGTRTRPYYATIDTALRAAAARGVKVKLMVSNWNTEKPAIAYLKSLSLVPNIEVRIVTLPQASTGFVPFARVIHSKAMSIDGKLAWVGTSNWSGGYFEKSRNLEVVVRNEAMAERVAAMHELQWSSPYAQPIDVMKDYPRPIKGEEAPASHQ
jgi:phosphatidylserine/phosphatidylglycerophosphate/cardiolipin synthase-like enzyme